MERGEREWGRGKKRRTRIENDPLAWDRARPSVESISLHSVYDTRPQVHELAKRNGSTSCPTSPRFFARVQSVDHVSTSTSCSLRLAALSPEHHFTIISQRSMHHLWAQAVGSPPAAGRCLFDHAERVALHAPGRPATARQRARCTRAAPLRTEIWRCARAAWRVGARDPQS
jgi:hypothetical protein